MSRGRLPRREHLLETERLLREAGFEFEESVGGKHGKLVVQVNGREETVIVSSSPSDRRAVKNAVGFIKRKIREWKAETGVGALTASAANRTLEIDEVQHSTELHQQNIETVEVLGRQITKVEYKGRPVVTLRQIDEAHGKPENAAYKQYNRHADRYSAEIDFIEVSASEFRNQFPSAIGKQAGGTIRLFTERGYGKIVKGWNDDISWQLHDAMQDAYFGAQGKPHLVPQNDDTTVLLEMLADLQEALTRSQNEGNASSLEHIDNSKAAVLHYLKAYVKQPSEAFFSDARARNLAAYKRDVRLENGLKELVRAVGELMQRSEAHLLERPFIQSEWYDVTRIYEDWFPGVVIPSQGFVSQQLSRALDSECKRNRRYQDMTQIRIGKGYRNFWHRDTVVVWMERAGEALINAHLRKFASNDQKVLPFPGAHA